MNLSVFSWFKRMGVPVLLSLVFLSSEAQSIVCTIEGTTTDTETKNLYLVESGADIRVKDEVITIPVVNGKFHYIWKGDEKLYLQLIADNQYQNGNIRAAFFIAENQQVVVKMGRADDKVVVKADGKETKMLQRCQKVMDAVYASRMTAMDEKMDSLEQLLERHMNDLNPSEKEQFIAELEAPQSRHPLVADYQQTEQA